MTNNLEHELFLSQTLTNNIDKFANSNANLLISGESGVGKDYVAKYIHYKSYRKNRIPIVINISAIPSDLLEKELFGSIKGAFTDSENDTVGQFTLADNSTLILDEIDDLPLILQSKLVSFIESNTVQPIGSNKSHKVNCRIIAITNRNLSDLVNSGKFRKDLFYRLNVLSIHIPPLRERVEYIKYISNKFLSDLTDSDAHRFFDKDVYSKLLSYDWPGNIRELRNCIERAITLTKSDKITSEYLLLSSDNNVNISSATLKEALKNFKKEYIKKVLESNDWNITKSSKILDIQRTYLSRLIKELYRD